MRHLHRAIPAMIILLASAHARELQELKERVRDGVQRTDKDLGKTIRPEKLTKEQRDKFDSAVSDLEALQEAVKSDKWQSERVRLERATDNIDFLATHASIDDADKQLLGIDVYTLRVILDSWKPEPGSKQDR